MRKIFLVLAILAGSAFAQGFGDSTGMSTLDTAILKYSLYGKDWVQVGYNGKTADSGAVGSGGDMRVAQSSVIRWDAHIKGNLYKHPSSNAYDVNFWENVYVQGNVTLDSKIKFGSVSGGELWVQGNLTMGGAGGNNDYYGGVHIGGSITTDNQNYYADTLYPAGTVYSANYNSSNRFLGTSYSPGADLQYTQASDLIPGINWATSYTHPISGPNLSIPTTTVTVGTKSCTLGTGVTWRSTNYSPGDACYVDTDAAGLPDSILPAGNYANWRLGGDNAKLYLGEGIYHFNSFIADQFTDVLFLQPNGARTQVLVENTLAFTGDQINVGPLDTTGNRGGTVLFYTNGPSLTIEQFGTYWGSFIAPNADVVVEYETSIFGQVFGKTVTVNQNFEGNKGRYIPFFPELPTISFVGSTGPTVTEGDPPTNVNAAFNFEMDHINGLAVTVYFHLESASATSGIDFTAVTAGSVTISSGDLSATYNAIVLPDLLGEATETFTLRIDSVQNGKLGATPADSVATGTILDNDNTPPQFQTIPLADTILTGTAFGPYTVTASDADTPVENLTLEIHSSDSSVLNPTNFTITTDDTTGGEHRWIFNGVGESNGVGDITLTLVTLDGNGGTDTATIAVHVYAVPVEVVNTGITLPEGGSDTVFTNNLQWTDLDDGTALLSYTVTAIALNGILYRSGVAISNGFIFSQQDIDDSLISYVHDGSETTADSLIFSISDPAGHSSAGQVLQITITPVNDIPVATDDAYAVNEDDTLTVAVAGVLSNDSDAEGSMTSILTDSTKNGQLTLATDGSFVYIPDLDFFGADSFSYAVDDGSGGLDTALVVITVNPVSDLPTLRDTTVSVSETASVSTVVLTLAGFDGDSDAFRYEIGSVIAGGAFILGDSTGILTVAAPLDYETTPSYSFTVWGIASGDTAFATVTVNVINVNDNLPTSGNFVDTIPENVALNTLVRTLTPVDLDGDLFLYEIASGDFGAFTVGDSSGELRVAAALDYEATSVYVLNMRAIAAGDTVLFTHTIYLENLNDNFPALPAYVDTIPETTPIGTAVLTVVGSDADGDVFRYEIISGNTNGDFALGDSTGVLSTVNALDFETTPLYTIVIRGIAAGDTITSTITIVIADVNDNLPIFATSYTDTLPENTAVLTNTVQVLATDADGDPITYEILSGNTGNAFFIDANSGQISLATALDFETTPQYNLDVIAISGGDTAHTAVTLVITNVNDNFPTVANYSATLAEDSATGSAVVTVAGSDADGDVFSYSISAGNTGSDFSIDAVTGVITIAKLLDFETTPSYTLTVDAVAGGQTAQSTVTITISNVNDNTPTVPNYSATLSEDSIVGSLLVTVVGSDIDGDAFRYEIASGNSGTSFSIGDSTGNLVIASALDFETYPSYTLLVWAIAAGDTVTSTITITITNVNDNAPTVPNYTATLAEDSATGSAVVTVAGSDADGDAFSYSINSGNTGSAFAIDALTGVITIAGVLDFETTTSYSLTVYAVAGGEIAVSTVSISITNVNDNTPTVPNYAATLAEDSAAGSPVVTVVGSDADGDSFSYNIASGNTNSDFAIDGVTGAITIANALDYETTSSYTLLVDATAGAETVQSTVVITIVNLNDNTPTVPNYSATLAEDSTVGSPVLTVLGSDADGDIFAYSISSGNTGTAFAINSSTGAITIASTLDYETTTSYTLMIDAVAGGETVQSTVTIAVTNVSDISPIVPSYSDSVPENAPVGDSLLTVTGIDGDGDLFLYVIASGNTNGDFVIGDSTGVLRVANALDYETTTSYSMVVLAIAAGDTAYSVVTIYIVNVNDNLPTVGNYQDSIPETIVVGSVVDTIVASDLDGDVFTYSISAGNTGGAFAIDASTGVITVAAGLDFETIPNYVLTVNAVAGGDLVQSTVTINLIDENDNAPIFASNYRDTIPENTALTTVVLTVLATDADGDIISYEIASGNTNSDFALNSSTGELAVAKVLDYETTTLYNLVVRAIGGGDTATATVDIWITNVNDNFPTIGNYALSIPENTPISSAIDTVAGLDADGDLFRYEIVGGNTGNAFIILDSTGVIVVNNFLDYETTTSYTLLVDAIAAGDTVQSTVTVTITNVNDNSPTVSDYTATLAEDSAVGSPVVTVAGNDADGDAFSYSITSGNTNFDFVIDAVTGAITIANALDYEALTSYTLIIDVTAGGETVQSQVLITITNVNDNAPLVGDYSATLAEDSAAGSPVVTVVGTDYDGDTFAYSISGGNTGNDFAINAVTGAITIAGSLDYERTTSYTLTVDAVAGGQTAQSTVTITIVNLNDNSPTVPDYIVSIAEDSAVGSPVGDVNALDADGDSFVYSIASGNTGNKFLINPGTGLITIASSLDYEVLSSYVLIVNAVAGGETAVSTVTINILNVNDNSPLVGNHSATLAEDSAAGGAVVTVVGTDYDGDTFAYSISGGNTGNDFAIDAVTGAITIANGLDYETTASYTLTVDAIAGGQTAQSTVNITITNVNDNPPTVGDYTPSVSESAAVGTLVEVITGSDADGSSFQYVLFSGNTNGHFVLDGTSGELKTAGSLDYESLSGYTLNIYAISGGDTAVSVVTVSVINVDDNTPTIPNYNVTLAEDTAVGSLVVQLVGVDLDLTPFTYEIALGNSAGDFSLNASTGNLTVGNVLDYERAVSYSFLVRAISGGDTVISRVNVFINDVNDNAPVIQDAVFNIDENLPGGRSVGQLDAQDGDNDALAYVLSGEGYSNFRLNNSGLLSTSTSPNLDFETKSIYTLTVVVRDGVYFDTATVIVNIADLNEAPTASDTSFTLAENSAGGVVVGTPVAADEDAGSSLSWMITGGNDGLAFVMDAVTGEITVASNAVLDFEGNNVWNLLVRASDGSLNVTTTVTIRLSDVNEAPVISVTQIPDVPENVSPGQTVGWVDGSDPDGDSVSYSIVGSNNTPFEIDPDVGTIRVHPDSTLDFESANRFVLTIEATDGTLTTTTELVIIVEDVPEFTEVHIDSVSDGDSLWMVPDTVHTNAEGVDIFWTRDGLPVVETLALDTGVNPFNVEFCAPDKNFCGRDSLLVLVYRGLPELVFLVPDSLWTNDPELPMEGIVLTVGPDLKPDTVDFIASADLVEGSNHVTFVYTDIYGNTDSASITVFLDTQVPVVEILEPLHGAIFDQPVVDVRWTVDGEDADTDLLESLEEGNHWIRRSFTDRAGNTGHDSVQVRLDLGGTDADVRMEQAVIFMEDQTVDEFIADLVSEMPEAQSDQFFVSIRNHRESREEIIVTGRSGNLNEPDGAIVRTAGTAGHKLPTLMIEMRFPAIGGLDVAGNERGGVLAGNSSVVGLDGRVLQPGDAIWELSMEVEFAIYDNIGQFVQRVHFPIGGLTAEHLDDKGNLLAWVQIRPTNPEMRQWGTGAFIVKGLVRGIATLLVDTDKHKAGYREVSTKNILTNFGYKRN